MIPSIGSGEVPGPRLLLSAWRLGWRQHGLPAFRSYPVRVALLIACYYFGGLVGREASFMSGNVALVWPPAGIALGAILLFGCGYWPWVGLGAVFFSVSNGTPLGFFTLGTALGNAVGALLCAWLLERFIHFHNAMERVWDVTGFVMLACLLGTTVNAAFNVVGLIYAGLVGWEQLFPALLEWWVPNAMAGLVVTPFLLAWGSPARIAWRWERVAEAAICALSLLLGTLVSFNSWYVYGIQNYPLAYLPYPFLVWGALRFGQRGATAGTLLVAIMSITALLHGRGPFLAPTEKESLMLIGSYLGILAITNMLLAAAATERVSAEQAVAQSEERYRGVVENQSELICRFQADGTLTFVNDAYCRFYGKDREQLLGSNYFLMLLPEDRHIPLAYLASLPDDKPWESYDVKVQLPEGQVVWQHCTIRRLFDAQEQTLEFQAVANDITERKLTEEKLRQSEEIFRIITDHTSDLIAVVSAEGKRIYNSPSYGTLLGSPEELIGTDAFERIHPEDQQCVQFAFADTLRTHEGRRVEYRFLLEDGSTRYIESQGNFVPGEHGQSDKVVTVARDITERKKVQEAVERAKEAAEASNRAKSQFLANMSHELRTPLNAIIGFSEVLADQTFGPMNDKQGRYANNILNSGRHLLQLINDVLDLAKVEAGRLQLAPEPFNVGAAIQDVQNIVKALANKKHIELKFEVDPKLSQVRADQPKFKQILYNLLSNAIKFTPESGRVSLRALFLEQPTHSLSPSDGERARVRGPVLHIAVADTGIGIQAKDQERIFKEFEQVDSSYARQQQGTGLGLTLTKRLVELHGGGIWVESEGMAGQGSVFSFEIPL